jgi:putative transposase
MDLFTKPGDFASFLKLLEQGRQRTGMRILDYCLMNNHWHMALWPRNDGDLSRFLAWVCTTHVRRWREHRESVGEGHLYQGRYKSFLVQNDPHLLALLRYIQANPLRAGIVTRAQDWLWSGLGGGIGADGFRVELTPWPVDRPRNWLNLVNQPLEEPTLLRLRTSIARGRPFGDDQWVRRIAARFGLERTLRDPWRPKLKHDDTSNSPTATDPTTW